MRWSVCLVQWSYGGVVVVSWFVSGFVSWFVSGLSGFVVCV